MKLSLVLLFFSFSSMFLSPAFALKKSYIVYLGSHAHGPEVSQSDLDRAVNSHHELLGSYLGSTQKAKDAIIYSYDRHINGFAAMLEEEEAAEIARHPKVVSLFENKARKLHTTRTWGFMLLETDGEIHHSTIWNRARLGEDTIIANLDTGVWPESKSFSHEGYGPIPSRWKGKCDNDTSAGVPCNRKLIGARFFNKGYISHVGSLNSSYNSARDEEGHGSHTLSTAGGNFVHNANVFGLRNGTAKGGSPKARVAAYKVCWPAVNNSGGCYEADIMKAFDVAMHDGVDVISISLGGIATDYFNDGIAIGAFHAVKRGIVVICSGGNSGPDPQSITNVAPWMITVGASTLDREFQNSVSLQIGKHLKGVGLSKGLPEHKFYPLITGAQAKLANATADNALLCYPGTLDKEKAKGKIVVCLRGGTARMDKGYRAALAGAVGMILCNDESTGNDIVADPHILPASHVSYIDGLAVFAYINSTDKPLGYISDPTAVVGIKPAPSMATFSSRGPNPITPEILKPDVTAPGVSVIAAYSEAKSPTEFDFDKRRVPFVPMSGTSMSCPHVSGVAGLLKTLHPDWSPAAIQSAIITTARTRDNTATPMDDEATSEEANPFSYGAGHIRPNRAQDPGLVYDLSENDYLDFLCALGYNETRIEIFSEAPYKCPKSASLLDFNYPSISFSQSQLKATVTVTRKLKNVGTPGKYEVRVREPHGISVTVEPKTLKFEKIGEEKKFSVTLTPRRKVKQAKDMFGELIWTDGSHYIRSPIAVSTV